MILVAVSPRLVNTIKNYNYNFLVNLSSMGGTDPSNFLNAVGKNPDGSGNGDILLWKRKAERYLVEVCFGCVDFNVYQVPISRSSIVSTSRVYHIPLFILEV